MKEDKHEKAKDSIMFLACTIFAILNLIRLETGMVIFSYISAIPGLFVVVAVFDSLLNLK